MLARGEIGPPTAEASAEVERRWRQLAAQGHVAAILWLGHFYNGLGPEEAPAKAASFYLDVIERRDADEQARSEARRFGARVAEPLVAAAESGDREATYQLGRWQGIEP